jgi:hypothetical protein
LEVGGKTVLPLWCAAVLLLKEQRIKDKGKKGEV